jgi:hypothetical protein
VGLGDIEALLHPHECFHGNSERFLNPYRHVGRQGCTFVHKGRKSGPHYAEDQRGVGYRKPKRRDDLGLYEPAGIGLVFHVNVLCRGSAS